jgi:SAM-dependent methyltransferase
VHRVLKPGGAFYLSTPYLSFLSTVLDPAWWLIGHRHYSKKKMHELASSTGFKIEDLQIRGGNWMMLFTHNLYISKWIFRRPVFFKEFFDRKMDEEFKENGYGNLILRMRKS